MEAIIFCGIQATGKSTFYRERFATTHDRVNLDTLKSRHREQALIEACLAHGRPFVVDNTNVTRGDRERYIRQARQFQFRVLGFYFESRVEQAILRNAQRDPAEQISERGIRGTAARLEIPSLSEGFDELRYVRLTPRGFEVQEWRGEV